MNTSRVQPPPCHVTKGAYSPDLHAQPVTHKEDDGQQDGVHNELLPPHEAVGAKCNLILEPQDLQLPAEEQQWRL